MTKIYNLINICPKRAIRSINKANYYSHTDPPFRSSQVLKVPYLYLYQSTLFLFDYVNKTMPSSFNNIFPFNRDIPTILQTRQSDSIPKLLNQWIDCVSFSRNQLKDNIKSLTILCYTTKPK